MMGEVELIHVTCILCLEYVAGPLARTYGWTIAGPLLDPGPLARTYG